MLNYIQLALELRSSPDDASGTHKQKDQVKRKGPSEQEATKTLDHAFVTPRVKSAAKSRKAVSLLNQIVREKDSLLKKAIEGMERKEKAILTNANNDFLKFVSDYLAYVFHWAVCVSLGIRGHICRDSLGVTIALDVPPLAAQVMCSHIAPATTKGLNAYMLHAT